MTLSYRFQGIVVVMTEWTRYKELEKPVLGMKQHQDLQEHEVKNHRKLLDDSTKKMDLLLETLNEEFQSEGSGVLGSM